MKFDSAIWCNKILQVVKMNVELGSIVFSITSNFYYAFMCINPVFNIMQFLSFCVKCLRILTV